MRSTDAHPAYFLPEAASCETGKQGTRGRACSYG